MGLTIRVISGTNLQYMIVAVMVRRKYDLDDADRHGGVLRPLGVTGLRSIAYQND